MIKKTLLCFLFLSLFLSISGCKKKLPTSPDIPEAILPSIEYFTANPESINRGESSTLSWSVSNATTITIDQGVGTVSAKATTEVSPEETTTYTLTATNSDGQKSQSCTVEIILNPPTIEYFTATPESIMLDSYSTLSWSTTNATAISVSPGVGTVSATGTVEVSPEDTTTYMLTATNSDGQDTKSCVVEIKKWAILDLSTNPESPIFYYDPNLNICTSNLTVIITETAGIGGQINNLLVGGFLTSDPNSICSSQEFGGGTFNPFGTLSRYCAVVIPCQPTIVIIYIIGVDNNGYVIDQAIWFSITWTQNMGLMRFLKIVDGQSHHKLIK